jgi:heparanase 1
LCCIWLHSRWLDQLAQAATTGHGAMCRQCLVGGNYSLLDQTASFRPNPDYWSAWVWRQLMGNTMLAITQVMPYEGDYRPLTRAYMSCTRAGAPGFQPGAVTLLYINSDASNASVVLYQQSRLAADRQRHHTTTTTTMGQSSDAADDDVGDDPWPPTPPPFPLLPRLEFVLTAADASAGLLSRRIALNGLPLEFDADHSQFPSLADAVAHGTTGNWVVPGHSYGFAVYPQAAAPACLPSAAGR